MLCIEHFISRANTGPDINGWLQGISYFHNHLVYLVHLYNGESSGVSISAFANGKIRSIAFSCRGKLHGTRISLATSPSIRHSISQYYYDRKHGIEIGYTTYDTRFIYQLRYNKHHGYALEILTYGKQTLIAMEYYCDDKLINMKKIVTDADLSHIQFAQV